MQKHSKIWHLVTCYSYKITPPELNYNIYNKKLLEIVIALKKIESIFTKYSAKTLVCAHASQHHTIAILSPNSIIHPITMQRSFGTEISGNQRPRAELSDTQRAGILSAVEVGEKKTEIAARYCVSCCVIYSTINQ